MRIAYLVFAYQNPMLIGRTIDRLTCDDVSFFVHIDARRDIAPFAGLRAANVVFADRRVRVHWAEFSGVAAIIGLIRQALAAPKPFDYFVLLSGSEYPLRSREYIHDFFEKHRGQEFITMARMPAPGKPLSRLNTVRRPSSRPAARFLSRSLAKVGLGQRDYRQAFGTMEPYSGMTWWALSREACRYVVDFVDRDTVLQGFFKDTFAPEETFFHTVLGNSPFLTRARRNLLYEDWSAAGAHPARLTGAHVAWMESQDEVRLDDAHGPGELLFARKLSDETLELTSRIDRMICRKEGRCPGDDGQVPGNIYSLSRPAIQKLPSAS